MVLVGLGAGLWFWAGGKDEARLLYEVATEVAQEKGALVLLVPKS